MARGGTAGGAHRVLAVATPDGLQVEMRTQAVWPRLALLRRYRPAQALSTSVVSAAIRRTQAVSLPLLLYSRSRKRLREGLTPSLPTVVFTHNYEYMVHAGPSNIHMRGRGRYIRGQTHRDCQTRNGSAVSANSFSNRCGGQSDCKNQCRVQRESGCYDIPDWRTNRQGHCPNGTISIKKPRTNGMVHFQLTSLCRTAWTVESHLNSHMTPY